MIPAKIEVSIDEQAIKEHIEKRLDGAIQAKLWFVDLKRMSELMCLSPRYIEDEIINHPYMKAIEIRKNRKRLWPAQKAFEVVNEILSSWSK